MRSLPFFLRRRFFLFLSCVVAFGRGSPFRTIDNQPSSSTPHMQLLASLFIWKKPRPFFPLRYAAPFSCNFSISPSTPQTLKRRVFPLSREGKPSPPKIEIDDISFFLGSTNCNAERPPYPFFGKMEVHSPLSFFGERAPLPMEVCLGGFDFFPSFFFLSTM